MLDEVNELMKKAEEKLRAAEYLLEGGYYSDAISRAYYAMYFAARALLALKKIYPKTHRGLIAKFGLEYVNKGIIDSYYAKALAYGEEKREVADYGILISFTREEAEDVIEDARNFLKKIEELLTRL